MAAPLPSPPRFPVIGHEVFALAVNRGETLFGAVTVEAFETGERDHAVIIVSFPPDDDELLGVLSTTTPELFLLYQHQGEIVRLKVTPAEVQPSRRRAALLAPLDVPLGERREFSRVCVQLGFYVMHRKGLSSQELRALQAHLPHVSYTATTIDLSASGVRFPSVLTLEPGDLVDIRIMIPSAERPHMSLVAEVVRAVHDDTGGETSDYGAKFIVIEPGDEEALVSFVIRKSLEQQQRQERRGATSSS